MANRITGRYERSKLGGEEVAAFIPYSLPPTEPPVTISGPLAERLRAAEQGLVRLQLAGEMVPSLDWFIYAFVRKEAVLSSQIEGTQATLVDLLTFEAQDPSEPSEPMNADVEEVCNYLEALMFTRAQLADPKGLPLSMRLLNETHRRLMRRVRGAEKLPGEVRRSQNWIGGSRPGTAAYVPPPPHALGETLGAFEKYMHAEDTLPPLVRLSQSMGTTRLQMFRKIRLPFALPFLFAGLKVAITLAVVGAFVGEWVGSEKGLGYVLLLANGQLDTALAFSAIIVLTLMGMGLFFVVWILEKLLISWHVSERLKEMEEYERRESDRYPGCH